jgi:triosephosphate isomerase (TIM)
MAASMKPSQFDSCQEVYNNHISCQNVMCEGLETMSKIIVANWKMNGSKAFAGEFGRGLLQFLGQRPPSATALVVCPPFVLIPELTPIFEGAGVAIGGQDCASKPSGAYTGEVSAPMLKDAGATYVILGHSERRSHHHETSAQVRVKAEMALEAGLTPIICVGESENERASGSAEAVVVAQLKASLPNKAVLIAYEPIWAIGSGRTPTSAEISAMHQAIKASVSGAKVLYGGSVNAANAEEILGLDGVDGALIGGASLKCEEFCAIVRTAENF